MPVSWPVTLLARLPMMVLSRPIPTALFSISLAALPISIASSAGRVAPAVKVIFGFLFRINSPQRAQRTALNREIRETREKNLTSRIVRVFSVFGGSPQHLWRLCGYSESSLRTAPLVAVGGRS
jgi:hypothetical protein